MDGKILVLGSTGNIGGLLVQDLQRKNADFIAGTHGTEGLDELKRLNVQAVDLDYNDPASLDNAMQGMERLFMLTPVSEKMINWGKNIIDAAVRNNLRFILRISIMDSNPHSTHTIFRFHGKVDQMLRESGISYAIVQSNVFMQNFSLYWGYSISRNDAFFSMHNDYRVSYVDMRDVAEICAAILTNPGAHQNREYTVTGSESLSDQDISRTLSEVAGRKIQPVSVDENRFREELLSLGMPEWDTNLYVSLEHSILEGQHSVISNDIMAITGKLSTTFEQFARDYAQTWEKAPAGVPG